MRIQNFETFVNESSGFGMHPYTKMLGYYDMSNSDMSVLIEALSRNKIDYSFDEYANFTDITGNTNIPTIVKYIEEACDGINTQMEMKYWPKTREDANDCVLLHLPKSNVPEGAIECF